jgi:hypothetical protein
MLKFSGWSTTVQALKMIRLVQNTKVLKGLKYVPNTVIGTEPWTCLS